MPGGRALPHRRRRARARHGRQGAGRRGRRVHRRGRRPALRLGAAGRLAGRHAWTRARSAEVEAAGIRCRAVPLMMTDVDATADDGPRRRWRWPRRSGHERRTGRGRAPSLPGVGAARDARGAAGRRPREADRGRHRRRRPGSRTATSCWSPRRSSARPRAGSSRPPTGRRRSTPRPCGWSPGAGALRIVENRQGLVMAAAGVDASNTPAGTVLLLPEDPDASARRSADGLRDALGVDVGVVVTDTFGRPWRNGLTDVAIGAAGVRVLDDLRGGTDAYGNPLERDGRGHRRRTGRGRRPGEGQGGRAAGRGGARAARTWWRTPAERRRGRPRAGAGRRGRHVPAGHVGGRAGGGDACGARCGSSPTSRSTPAPYGARWRRR